MSFTEYIKPEFLVVVPVLYVIGILLKNSKLVKDNLIPLFLSAVSVVMALIYVFSVSDINENGFQSIMGAIFTALTQGFLAAGAAVLCNQIKKQSDKDKKDD